MADNHWRANLQSALPFRLLLINTFAPALRSILCSSFITEIHNILLFFCYFECDMIT